MNEFEFNLSTRVYFGCGRLNNLPEILAGFNLRDILIVTDGLEGTGIISRAQKLVSAAGISCQLFAEVEPDPTIELVEKGLHQLQRQKSQAVVAIGGGSSIDAAKAISLLATNGGRISSYEGANKVTRPGLPLVAVPTTAGSGSEITAFAVITDRQRDYKMTVSGINVSPLAALVDPELTLTMPARLTACTGMDALTHAIESFVSNHANPMTEAWSLEAIRMIGRHLRVAASAVNSIEARSGMLAASTLAGASFSTTRLGNAHAMAHPVGARFRVPHGMANAVLLPYVMRFNLPAAPQKYAKIAAALGEDLQAASPEAGAGKAVAAVVRLSRELEIPENLKELGVKDSDLRQLAEDAMTSGNVLANPRQTGLNEMVALFKEAYYGFEPPDTK